MLFLGGEDVFTLFQTDFEFPQDNPAEKKVKAKLISYPWLWKICLNTFQFKIPNVFPMDPWIFFMTAPTQADLYILFEIDGTLQEAYSSCKDTEDICTGQELCDEQHSEFQQRISC